MAKVSFDGLNLVVKHMEATLTFYRRLGVEIPDDAVWSTPSGIHHVNLHETGEHGLSFDSHALAKQYNAGFAAERGRVLIGFRVETREAVDALWTELVGFQHQGLQEPFDAFWGARYAIIEDPDGNPVGIMSPSDPAMRQPPPDL